MKFSSFSATLFQQVYFPSTKKRKNIASISYRLFLIIFFFCGGGGGGGWGGGAFSRLDACSRLDAHSNKYGTPNLLCLSQ